MTALPRTARLLLSGLSTAFLLTFLGISPAPSCAAETAAPVPVESQAAPAGAGAATGAPKAPAKEPPLPTQYGMSAEYGYAFDPSPNPSFLLARMSAIYDYGSVWHQDCPNTLRFKVEAAAGSTLSPEGGLVASVNMLALKYPGKLGGSLRPYVEGGIGVIYTQYRVKDQGLRFNFNPVLGAGLEMPEKDGKNLFAAIRFYHLSNAEIDRQNRGVNSVALQVGRLF
jgi:lipid A 3-O-deacylase